MRARSAIFLGPGISLGVVLALPLLGFACGDDGAPQAADASLADSLSADARADAGDLSDARDAGDAGDGGFVPGAHLPYPLVTYGGGPVLGPPHLVVVTFPGDPLAGDVNDFAEAIPASAWWRTVNGDTCAGADAGADAVAGCVLPSDFDGSTNVQSVTYGADAAASYDQAAVAALLHDAIARGTVPVPDARSLYVVSFPLATTLTTLPTGTGSPAGTSCSTFLEYHRQLYIGDLSLAQAGDGGAPVPTRVPYIALPRCSRQPSDVSVPLGRALVAAAQDPNGSAWVVRGPAGFNAYFGTEAPDLCTPLAPLTLGGIALPRVWSNAAALTGDPCVPSDGQTYFAVAPHDAGDVYMPFNETRTVAVDVFSDGPTAPFQLEVADLDEILAGMPTLSATIDRTSAVNGDTAHVTVHFNNPPGERGFAVLVFFAVSGATVHGWPLAVHLE